MTVATVAFQLLIAFVSTLGFALLFHLRPALLAPACLGGLVTWAAYLACGQFIDGVFFPCLIASVVAVSYAQLLAWRTGAPLAVFYILAEVPLIPGSGLFNTMSSMVGMDWSAAAAYGITTATFVSAIALSIAAYAVAVGVKDVLVRRLAKTKSSQAADSR